MRADWDCQFKPTPKWKRTADVIGAVLMLVLLSPLMILVMLTIKLTSPGPVFFRQQRHGGRGEMFWIWKFRTMRDDADSNHHRQHVAGLVGSGQPLHKIDAAKDCVPMARFWRATGIDELPQLINVLRGEMSLVGPRPDVLTLDEYESWQLRRFEVVPGLTGLWQVGGKNQTTFDEMINLDIHYVDNCSLLLDTRILLKTVPAIIGYALD